MHRILTSILASAFALTLGTSSAMAAATPAPMATKAATKMSSMKPMTCPKGQTWVKPYAKKDGTKVAGYCRKAATPK
jgi:hypothetical protein